jgi:hypothetical protein
MVAFNASIVMEANGVTLWVLDSVRISFFFNSFLTFIGG